MSDNPRYGLDFKYRVVIYLTGIAFAAGSYVTGIWVFSKEAAAFGNPHLYDHLINQPFVFHCHAISFIAWLAICTGIAMMLYHIMEREVYRRRVFERKANIDGLTGIYNHRYLQDRFTIEIERARRYDRTLSMIMLDLDNFKAFNDAWGHQEGDKLLKWFAATCSECVRGFDVLARYGGEEFAILLPETDFDEALAVAERIRQTTEQMSGVELGRNRTVTVSAGIATYPVHARSRHALILNADAALYFAKQEGKNRCSVYHEESHKSYRASPEHLTSLAWHGEMDAIEALAAAVDSREPHMKSHSAAVMRLSVALGERMGMSTAELEDLRAAALLHDLGKIGTPEEVLGKPSMLRAEERATLENHPAMGAKMLKRIQQLNSIVPGIKHHHERYDGEGYPDGLAGKSIPLVARMIAIADAFDAMTSGRSYREPKSVEDAIQELHKCAGQQFDPELVELFVAVVHERRHAA